jgi:hypothetical protein
MFRREAFKAKERPTGPAPTITSIGKELIEEKLLLILQFLKEG